MADVKQFVDAKISEKKVVMFSKTYCGFCAKAKRYLKMHIPDELSEEDYLVIEIENNPKCQAIQDYLLKKTGGRSVSRHANVACSLYNLNFGVLKLSLHFSYRYNI